MELFLVEKVTTRCRDVLAGSDQGKNLTKMLLMQTKKTTTHLNYLSLAISSATISFSFTKSEPLVKKIMRC